MSGGHNRKFLADPAGYPRNKTILVPDHSAMGFWSGLQHGPFDLSEFKGSGFPGTVLALTHMSRRSKAQSSATRLIPGIWIPYTPGQLIRQTVTANTAPYFVFTSKLGGCALGMRDLNNATTSFSHDATNVQAKNLADSTLTFFQSAYDPADVGLNVTAFFWWDGMQWTLGHSTIYNARVYCQTFGNDSYPRKM